MKHTILAMMLLCLAPAALAQETSAVTVTLSERPREATWPVSLQERRDGGLTSVVVTALRTKSELFPLKVGDRVVSLNGELIRDLDHLKSLFRLALVGTRGRVQVRRAGAVKEFTVVFYARPERPMLGVVIMETAFGVEVDEVKPGSPADKAGLKKGDRIERIAGRPVREAEALSELVRELEVGERVVLNIRRQGKALVLKPVLTARRRAFLGIHHAGGSGAAKVLEVIKRSPAERVGLKVGDEILTLNGRPLSDWGGLQQALGLLAPETTITLGVRRKKLRRLY